MTGEDKKVHSFPKSIIPNVKVIARLRFEVANDDISVQLVNHNATPNFLEWTRKFHFNFIRGFVS